MKKILVLIGIIMFSLTVMADDSRYGFIPQPQQNYGGGYSSGYDDGDYRSHGSSSFNGSAGSWYGNSSISDRKVGNVIGSGKGMARTLRDDDGGIPTLRGGNGSLTNPGGEEVNPPVGDAILPLSLMSLIFAGFVYLKKVRK